MAQVAEVVTYVQLCLVASVEAVGGGGLLERQGKGPHYKKSPSLPFLQPLLRGEGMIVGRPQLDTDFPSWLSCPFSLMGQSHFQST